MQRPFKNTIQLALWAFILVLAGLPSGIKASHIMAQEFTYECLGNGVYRIYNTAYRDCSGASVISLNIVSFTPVSGTSCGTPTVSTSWLTNSLITEVTPICPSVPTNCTTPGSTIRGVEEFLNYADYDFSSTSCPFYIEWSNCCRNAAITNGGANQATYTDQTIIDPTLSTCNNSPVFTSLPVFFICQGDTTTVNQGCYDQEGDSLVYSMAACQSNSGTSISYSTGYSATAPLGSSWGVSLDSQNGNLTFTPTPGNLEVGVICMLVEEYRNGQLIGQLWRDVQVAVTNCGTNNNPGFDSLVVVNGGSSNGNTVNAVAGTQVCFDLYGSDPDVGQTLKIYWDGNVSGGTFFDPSNVNVTDTVVGSSPVARFCFTPTTPGSYQFLTTVEDNACPFPGFEDMFVNINVTGTGIMASATQTSCLTYQFNVVAGGGTGPYTYSWSGTGGLSSSSASFSHTYTSPGTYSWSVTVTDTSGFNHTQNGTVNVSNVSSGNIIGQPNALGCAPDSVLLAVTGGGAGTYLWSNGATTPATWVHTAGMYSVSYTDPAGCITLDTVYVGDTVDVAINGIALDYFLNPLENQPVLLIYYNPADSSLTAMDTAYTDTTGIFRFECPTQYSTWYLKAIPDSALYPNTLPTYYDSALVWQNAVPYTLPSNNFAVILCRQGANPGGPGFIGGLISQGANKTTDPVADLRLILVDDNNTPMGYTETNADGYFSFPNLPQGKYKVWVDKPHVSNPMAPEIELGPQTLNQDSLAFVLHPTWLELLTNSTDREETASLLQEVQIMPNPFKNQVSVNLNLNASAPVTLTLRNLQGQEMGTLNQGMIQAGHHTLQIDAWNHIPAGIYFVQIATGTEKSLFKLIKVN